MFSDKALYALCLPYCIGECDPVIDRVCKCKVGHLLRKKSCWIAAAAVPLIVLCWEGDNDK